VRKIPFFVLNFITQFDLTSIKIFIEFQYIAIINQSIINMGPIMVLSTADSVLETYFVDKDDILMSSKKAGLRATEEIESMNCIKNKIFVCS